MITDCSCSDLGLPLSYVLLTSEYEQIPKQPGTSQIGPPFRVFQVPGRVKFRLMKKKNRPSRLSLLADKKIFLGFRLGKAKPLGRDSLVKTRLPLADNYSGLCRPWTKART